MQFHRLQCRQDNVQVLGDLPQPGQPLPGFMLVDSQFNDVSLAAFAGRPVAVMTPAIAEALREVTVVWLSVSVTQASRRVGLNQARPLLLGNMRATLIKLLAERTPVYQNLATITVDADRTGVRAIVDQIISELKEVDE